MNIGIIGNGFVGKATYQLKCKDINILSYDINPKLCNPIGLKLVDLLKCEIIFVSVPTPMKNGECYLDIVKSVINDLKKLIMKIILYLITVPVGTSDFLGVYFMPEFLTEKTLLMILLTTKIGSLVY